MSATDRSPPPVVRPKATLSIRARLLALALIAVVPLMIDRARLTEVNRAERLGVVANEAMAIARQGIDAQHEIIVAVKSIMQVVARAHATIASSEEGCARFLAGTMSDAPWIRSLSIIGANGRVACTTQPNTIGLDVSDRTYFQKALSGRTFVVSDYVIGHSRGGLSLVAAAPTWGPNGENTGVITAGVDLLWIERLVAEIGRRPGAALSIIDGTGTVLAAYPDPEKWFGKKLVSSPLVQTMTAQSSGTATLEGIDGVRRIFGFTRLPDTDAYLAAGLDETTVLRGIDREMWLSYAQFAIVGLIVLFGVWIGGERSIVRPIRLLARAASRIGYGDLDARATRRDWAAEFVPLATALDNMALRLHEREEELRIANTHLEQLTRLDSLSGLANRRGFDLRLETEWQQAAKSGLPFALLMIDVDHFKLFNDRYGHVEGDACLRAVGEALAQAGCWDAAIVARYGGEEFAVLVANADSERALRVGETLRAAIEALNMPHESAPLGRVTVSVGVASLKVVKGLPTQILIEAADAALYGAKRRGRNAVVSHSAIELLKAG